MNQSYSIQWKIFNIINQKKAMNLQEKKNFALILYVAVYYIMQKRTLKTAALERA